MSEPVIQHWERVIHKNVRSKDRVDIGNVVSESGETFTVMQGAKTEYNIPKSAVEAFDGSELYLSIPYSEVLSYSSPNLYSPFLISQGKQDKRNN